MYRIPPVAIGLPVYNGEKYLSESIESVLVQDFGDFDFLISDNCSTDSTWEICNYYASKDKRIRLNRNKKNLGMIANFQLVLDQTKSKYFMWHAADDIILPIYLRACYTFLENNLDYVVCFSRRTMIDQNRNKVYSEILNEERIETNILDRIQAHFHNKAPSNAIYGLILRRFLKKIGHWPVTVTNPDGLLVFELLLAGKSRQLEDVLRYCGITLGFGARKRYLDGYGPKGLLASRIPIALLPNIRWKLEFKNRIRQTALVDENTKVELLEMAESFAPWSKYIWIDLYYYIDCVLTYVLQIAPRFYPKFKK
jgi:glycosyltransferase involved in cell wall biosynthesis